MKLALAFTSEAVSLLRADADGWRALGVAAVGAEDFGDQVARLRAMAGDAGAQTPEVALVLPPEHVIAGEIAPEIDDVAADDALRAALTARGAPDPALLAWAVGTPDDGQPRRYCAALRDTVEEAARYARGWGFKPTGAGAPGEDGGPVTPLIAMPGAAITAPLQAEPAVERPAAERPAAPTPLPAPKPSAAPAPRPAALTAPASSPPRAGTARRPRGSTPIWVALGVVVGMLALLAWRLVPEPPSASPDSAEATATQAATPEASEALDAPGADASAGVPAEAATRDVAEPAAASGAPPPPQLAAEAPAPVAGAGAEAGSPQPPDAPNAPPATANDQAASAEDEPPSARAAVELSEPPAAIIATMTPLAGAIADPVPSRAVPPSSQPTSIDDASPRAETTPDSPPQEPTVAAAAPESREGPGNGDEALSATIAPSDATPDAQAAERQAADGAIAAGTDAPPQPHARPGEAAEPSGQTTADASRPGPEAVEQQAGAADLDPPPQPIARPGEAAATSAPTEAEVEAPIASTIDAAIDEQPADAGPPPPAAIMPPERPSALAAEAEIRRAALTEAGPRPAPRPRDLAAPATAPAQTAERPRSGPSSAPRSIRTAATISDGLPEGLALLGVFGSSDGRRALVRGEDGAIRRVRRGDRIDGWSVAAIEADAIRLTADGRSQTLRVPGR